MSKSYFFKQIFNKGEEAKYLYEDYDFAVLSKDEVSFLNSLLLFSRFKTYLKNFLTSDNTGLNNKRRYIELNAGYLEYDEFAVAERALEKFNETFISLSYSYGFTSILFILVAIYKRPTGYPILTDTMKILSTNLFLHIGMMLFYRRVYYRPNIEKVYKSLNQRLNLEGSNLKFKNTDEGLMENYFKKL